MEQPKALQDRIADLERSNTYLAVLYAVASSISVATDAQPVMELVLDQALDALKAEAGMILLREGNDCVVVASRGLGSPAFVGRRYPLDKGVVAEVAKSGQPITVYRGQGQWNEANLADSTMSIRAILCYPIQDLQRVLGVIYLARFCPDGFSTEENWMLNVLANRARVAIESARLYQDLRIANEKLESRIQAANMELIRKMEEISGLYNITHALMSHLVKHNDLQQILDIIIEKVNSIVATNISTIRLINRATGELEVRASLGIPAEIIPRIKLKSGEGLVGTAFKEGHPILGEDLAHDPRFAYFPQDTQKISSEIAVPLKIGNDVFGVLACASSEPRKFTGTEVALLLSAADLAAVAISNAQLYEKLRADKAKA